MQNPVSQVPDLRSRGAMERQSRNVGRTMFDRSLRHSTTGEAGLLLPLFADEILPGDTVRLDASFFVRLLSPLNRPVMDELELSCQMFFVPFRLLQDNWEKLMGARDNPGDHTDYLVPEVVAPVDGNGYQRHSLSDYLGIRTETDGIDTSAFYHRAYYRIWDDFYRDENLQDKLDPPTDDGPDASEDYVLQRRGKRRDYITGSLPWVQKGDPVRIPVGDTAPLTGLAETINSASRLQWSMGGQTGNVEVVHSGSGPLQIGHNLAGAGPTDLMLSDITTQYVDLSAPAFPGAGADPAVDLTQAIGITVNEFRDLIATQHLLERDARGGTRYIELLSAHWGVAPEDRRLQRPEFLWSTSTNVPMHVVADTAGSGGASEIGRLGGYMQGVHSARGFTKSFSEHGVLMGLISVRAPLRYQQNVPRFMKRSNRFDFYWPDYALLGEQPVYNYEVFAQGTSADTEVFGYQPRYEEYRRRESMITGALRSDDPTSLDVFHLAQDFGALPTLSSDFIEEDPPVDRVIIVQDEPQFMFDCNWMVRHARLMPAFADPGLERL